MLRRFRNLAAGLIIAAAPIATLMAPGIAHAASFTCTWTGAGADAFFSTSGNWSGCNGAAPDPADTDDFVFPVSATSLTANNDLVNGLANITVSSVTFSGTGGAGYDISGNGFTLAGDVTDSSSQDNIIENDVNVSGARNVSVTAPALVDFQGVVSGTGSLTSTGSGSVVLENLTLTGALAVNAGSVQVYATSAADATFSGVTVASGATFGYDAFTNSSTTTYTMSKPITSSGSLDFQGGSGTQTLNLTGTLTLTADTDMVASSGTTVHIQGSLHGPGFKVTSSGGTVLNESTDNTTDTPSGNVNGTSGSGSGSNDGGDAPATPDTGFALVANHPAVSMAITLASAGSILAIARMSRKFSNR